MKKRLALVMAIVMLVVVFAGCNNTNETAGANTAPPAQSAQTADPGQSAQTPPEGQPAATTKTSMIVTSYSDPQSANPYFSDNRNAMRVYFQCYERLLNRGEGGAFTPMLAESWIIADDGLSITFKLRHGVKFHNGEEMKASDVVFSFKEMSTYGTVMSGLDWMQCADAFAEDDYTVVLPLSESCSLTLNQLANTNMVIVSEKGWKELGDGVSTTDVGTGPFYVSDYMINDHVTFTRFEDYWGEKPLLETVTMRFIGESTQAAIELETGGVDLILDVAAVDYDRIDTSENMKLSFFSSNTNDFLNFNTNDEIFKNVKVRQALAYAMNREDIFKAVYMNWGRIAYNVLTPDIWAYNPEFEGDNYPYKQDLDKAKALLAEAGYPDGFEFALCIDQDVNRQGVSQILKNQFEKIGVTVNINNMEQSTLNDMIAQNTAQSWLFGINAATMEPDRALFIRWHSSCAYNGGSNHTRFVNEEYSNLLTKARITYDAKEKEQLYFEAQRIWMENVPSIPYYVRPQVVASITKLQGLQGYGEGYLFAGCYFE